MGSDADGTIARYSWIQVSGRSVALSGAAQASASFVAPDVDANMTLVFRLAVTDDEGAAASDEMIVTVLPATNRAPRLARTRR